jgi:glycosyltransferase involved in cell wall biosynthesis
MKLSFIMSARNSRPLVARAISSFATKIQFNWRNEVELIAYDDGSHDGTADLLESMKVNVIKGAYVGQAEGRNIAIAHSKGDYLAFLDADDIIYTDIDEYVTAMDAMPNVGVVYGEIEDAIIDSDMTVRKRALRPSLLFTDVSGNEYDILQFKNFTLFNTVLIRRQAFIDSGGFVKGIVCGEDGVLLRHIAEIGWGIQHINSSYQLYCTYQDSKLYNQSRQLRTPPGGFHIHEDYNGRELENDNGSIKEEVLSLNYKGFDKNSVRPVWVKPRREPAPPEWITAKMNTNSTDG